jgi:UDP-2-acetamido-3-amino-2,3-dideoxy-glucuronate N-acetyltransferase
MRRRRLSIRTPSSRTARRYALCVAGGRAPKGGARPYKTVGKFTKVWYFSQVAPGAVIGENCSLGQNTYVERNAIVGNACRLGNSVSIFSHVELEDLVFCAPYMVFAHISFPRAAVNRHAVFRKTLVRTGTTLGANSTVVPDVTCGVGTFLAPGSTLTKSSKDWSMMVGTPARQVGWVSAFGEKIELPLSGSGEWRCGHTGDVYVLDGSELIRHPGSQDVLKYVPGKRLERMTVGAACLTLQDTPSDGSCYRCKHTSS